ncbi:MAG: hypothetical protein HXX18_14995 [Bacteroidetes bacterium]|nr:hypothetical protein [Bacteroidota bacterium]
MYKINNKGDDFEYIPLGNSKEYYQTADLGLATALCCKNYVLLTLDKQDPRKVSFIFKRKSGIEEDADTYWSKDLNIKARDYFDNLRTLKNRIYSSE